MFLDFSCICPNDEHYGIADVGLVRPVGLAPEAHRDAHGIKALALAPSTNDEMETVVGNLEGLMAGIPDYMGVEEVPIEFHIHIVGVIPRVHHLLRRVARVVVCYREHNPPQ